MTWMMVRRISMTIRESRAHAAGPRAISQYILKIRRFRKGRAQIRDFYHLPPCKMVPSWHPFPVAS
jgi:hypothetical protein